MTATTPVFDVTRQTALVTGGGSGIGRGIAATLLAAGARVVIGDVRPAALQESLEALREVSPAVSGHVLDVTERGAFREVVATIECDLGPIDLLINNAGVGYSGFPLQDTPDDDLDWVIAVNLRGVLNGIRACVPQMVKRRHGWVVNVSSMSGLAVPQGIHHGLYGATKAAVISLSEGLRMDVANAGVGVSVLCPGYVQSNLPYSSTYRGRVFGGAIMRSPNPAVLESMARALPARIVGNQTVAALARGDFLIFTDLQEAGDVRAWHQRIDVAMQEFRKRSARSLPR